MKESHKQKTRRQLQAERTKDRLFEAAITLLAEKDFEQITIRDIVSGADVSIGTFYKYYSTKMEVFYETYRIADQYFEETVAPTLTQPTAQERILAFFDAYALYSSVLTDMKMTKLLYNPNNTFFNRDMNCGMLAALVSAIQYGLGLGELTGGDTAEEMANFFMISVRGLVYNWCTTYGAYDLKAATRKFVLRLLRGYLSDPK